MAHIYNNTELKEVFINNANLRYFADRNGNIYSMTKTSKMKKIKIYTKKDGYQVICVLDNSQRDKNGLLKTRILYAHRLIVGAWLADGDYNFELEVNHINSNPSDNNLSNLEIVSHTDNILHTSNNKLSYVSKIGKSYRAIVHNKLLGYFNTERLASVNAYNYFIDNGIEIPKYAKFKI